MSNNRGEKKINILLVACIAVTFVSCGMTKTVDKQRSDKKVTEQIISKAQREGDSVTYVIPNIQLKDTTVYTYNHVGTRLETRYDKEGYVDRVRCIEAAMDQFTVINRELITSIKTKQKEEKGELDKTLVYGILAILVFGLFYIVFRLEAIKLP